MPPSPPSQSPPLPAVRREIVVSLNYVSRFFEGRTFVHALNNLNFEVYRGDLFGFLGPAGCGKSTFLKILAGRLSPSEGKVKLFGGSPRRRAIRARTGYLPGIPTPGRAGFWLKLPGFLKHLFAVSSVSPPARSAVGPAQRTGDGHPDISPIPRSALRSPHSSLRLAQLLLRDHDLLLLDEPFAGLDPAACLELKTALRAQARQGKTVILTSDSLCYTAELCTRMALCHGGVVEATGTLDELLSLPNAVRITAQLLPPRTAQRALQIVRHDLAGHQPPPPLGPLEAKPRDAAEKVSPRLPSMPQGADGPLSPLFKAVTPASPSPITEATSAVNHEMLAALARPAGETPPPPAKSTEPALPEP